MKKGESWLLLDLGSKNGTYLNKIKLVPYQPVLLNDEDRIQLGLFRGSPRIIWSPESCSHATLLGPQVWTTGWLEDQNLIEPKANSAIAPEQIQEKSAQRESKKAAEDKLTEIMKGLSSFLFENQLGLVQISLGLLGIVIGMLSAILPPVDRLLERTFLRERDRDNSSQVHLQSHHPDERERSRISGDRRGV